MSVKRILVRKGSGKTKPTFKYVYDKTGKTISKNIEDWINTQYIPHSWEDTIIYPNDSKYLAIGWFNGQKTYMYKKDFKNQQSIEKYCRLRDFGKKLSKIKSEVTKLIKSNDDYNKSLGLALWVLMNTYIRVGNDKYLKENNTHGLLTLQKKHLNINGNRITFNFVGKKSVENTCTVNGPANIISALKKLLSSSKGPQYFVFHNGKGSKLKPDDINKFIQTRIGPFTAKDFRTWGANIEFIKLVRKLKSDLLDTKNNQNKAMKEVVNRVSSKLNNTISVCKSNYIVKEFFDYYKHKPQEFVLWVQKQNGSIENILIRLLDYYCSSKSLYK